MSKILYPFTDLKQVSGDFIDRDLLRAGDEITIIRIYDGCSQPGCCPAYIVFTVNDMPELGILDGEIAGKSAQELNEAYRLRNG